MSPTKKAAAWKALESHAAVVSRIHLRQLFAEARKRGERMAAEDSGLRDRIDAISLIRRYRATRS